MTASLVEWFDQLRWDDDGLVPVVTQDAASGRVLTVAWTNREGLAETVRSGEAVYWSRSRKRLWHKGEESGHVQKVLEVRLDCDADAVLLKVEQHGGIACHTGRESCFFRRLEDGRWVGTDPVLKDPALIYRKTMKSGFSDVLERVARTIEERKGGDADASYVAALFAKGESAILKKIGEEATETMLAAKDGDRLHLVRETADLWFHCMVMLAHYGLGPQDVLAELRRREGISGIDEKVARKAKRDEK